MAAPSEGKPVVKFDTQKLLKNVCFRYIPIAGGVSSLAFSANVMNPALMKR